MFKEKVLSRFRKYFITGMIVIIPLWVTVLLINAMGNLIDSTFKLLPAVLQPKTYLPYFGIDIIIALVIIVLVGLIANNYLGKKFIRAGELILSRIPVIKTIYQGIKHLTRGIVSEQKIFSRVVLLEFPIKGLSFIGFVTGESSKIFPGPRGKKMLKIFIPTTPNPTTGFFCFAAQEEVKDLNISVDEAFKLIISAGYSDAVSFIKK